MADITCIKLLEELDRGDLALAGGKGANLGALLHAGLPVPPGFCLTTAAYRCFVEANCLQERILEQVAALDGTQPQALEAASAAIAGLFQAGSLPGEIAAQICAAYRAMAAIGDPPPGPAVAVRSSATAEDLPSLSFAGQQDTYLNVVGEPALLQAVVRCWASLWTARAIGYRLRNGIPSAEIALAVVVQRMVPSQVSGVLFTANPLTGKRSETVIDAAFGLGEALVAGMVEPDHYVVAASQLEAAQDLEITRKTLGAKALSVRGRQGGGVQTVAEDGSGQQALPDPQILELARLGSRAAGFFGAPQDVEWAWSGGQLYILQSRAITSLYPLPQGVAEHPLEVLFSFGAWQGMLDPISPLGQDMFTGLMAGIGRCFGALAGRQEQRTFLEAGGRLFVNLTGLVRSSFGRSFLDIFITAIDPTSASVFQELFADPQLSVLPGQAGLAQRLRLLGGAAPVIRGVLYNLLWPEGGRARLAARIEQLLARLRARCAAAQDISALAEVLEETPLSAPGILLPYLLPAVIAGQVPLQILVRLAAEVPGGEQLVFELTRGLPHNVTTEMDLRLWAVSRAILADPPSAACFAQGEAGELAAQYLSGQLPPAAQAEIGQFMQAYGARGVAEIDLYRPRWKDDPRHIMQVLKGYLLVDESSASPAAVFRRGAARAAQAREELVAALRHTPGGALRARLARCLAGRVFELTGLRETPKYVIVLMLDALRQALLPAGRELARAGVLAQAEDIFFLHTDELKQLGACLRRGESAPVVQMVRDRRQEYARELGRRRVPHLLLSDGRAYFEGHSPAGGDSDRCLCGTPVSAGMVEGTVRVVLDPYRACLVPGEILVCPATDPAWTPLFLSAGGLVMEVGGLMTHGSVVAREYGIPAVVGVSQATTRLKTGQRVRVDGSSGQVILLEG